MMIYRYFLTFIFCFIFTIVCSAQDKTKEEPSTRQAAQDFLEIVETDDASVIDAATMSAVLALFMPKEAEKALNNAQKIMQDRERLTQIKEKKPLSIVKFELIQDLFKDLFEVKDSEIEKIHTTTEKVLSRIKDLELELEEWELTQVVDGLKKLQEMAKAWSNKYKELQELEQSQLNELRKLRELEKAKLKETQKLQELEQARLKETQKVQELAQVQLNELKKLRELEKAKLKEIQELRNAIKIRNELSALQEIAKKWLNKVIELHELEKSNTTTLDYKIKALEQKLIDTPNDKDTWEQITKARFTREIIRQNKNANEIKKFVINPLIMVDKIGLDSALRDSFSFLERYYEGLISEYLGETDDALNAFRNAAEVTSNEKYKIIATSKKLELLLLTNKK
jgi:hypothetical protein